MEENINFFQEHSTENPDLPYKPNIEDIQREKDFYLKAIKIVAYNGDEYDITYILIELNIYEDLFSHTMSGNVSFRDSQDLPQLLPIIGQEKLKVVFTRPSESGRGLLPEDFSRTFRVYKLDNLNLDSNKHEKQNYTLHFVSEEYLKNLSKRVSKHYKEPISKIVEKVYKDYVKVDKPLETEQTLYDRDLILPNYSPLECIQMLASQAISSEGNKPGYLFFEDMDKFNFKSIGKLLDGESSETLSQFHANVLDHKGNISNRNRTIESDIYNVETYRQSNNFDLINGLKNGTYGQTLLTVDPLRQIYEHYKTSYNKEYDTGKRLEKNKLHTEDHELSSLENSQFFMAFTDKDHDVVPHIVVKDPEIKPAKLEEYTLQRNFQLEIIDLHKIQLKVSGDPRRRVGKIIEFLVPNRYGAFDKDHPQDPPNNKYLTGRFLVTALKHTITRSSYYNEIEIVKDSYLSKIERVDLKKFFDWAY